LPEASRGTLVLVVGPSGAGKDTLIGYCRRRLAGDPRVVFPRRVVTREGVPAIEDHDTLTADAFEARARANGFALHWDAHGLRYGIPAAIEADLAAGRTVVANVSRTVLDKARRRFAPLCVAAVTASREVLAQRLGARGRESDHDIGQRLDRGALLPVAGPDVAVIDNSGLPEVAGERLLSLLKGQA
jgi:ribose 1,5-bisphosphokinase